MSDEKPKTTFHPMRGARPHTPEPPALFHRIFDSADMVRQIPIYDRDAIRAALDVDGDDWDDGGWVGPEAEAPARRDARQFSVEETQWRRTLRQIAEDRRGPLRDVLIGTSQMAADVADLDSVAPHMGAVTALIRRSIVASKRTGTRLRFPPLCLLGPPGIGKTFYAKRLAKALGGPSTGGIHFVEVPMNMVNERGRLSGYSMAWRGARIGDLALAVLAEESRTSGPLIFFDEIDKVDPRERLHDVLLSVLEPENARRFVDEYLTAIAPVRLDHAHVIATANDVSGVPAPLLDRMLVLDVAAPSGDDLRQVICSVYATVAESYGRFCPFVDLPVMGRLEGMSPRRMKRTLDLAVPAAIAAGRWNLDVEDLDAAGAMVEDRRRRGIGFLR